MAADAELQCWGVLAASGSGKGLWIKGKLRALRPSRLVIYDYKDEYAEFGGKLMTSLEAVRTVMLAARNAPAVIRFRSKPGTGDKAKRREFEVLCRLVQAWQRCVFIAEELSNVTTPGWAPPAWREMTTGGRHERVHIIGVAQNPALIDKTFLSNCTLIHVGPLREFHHRQYVARSMDVPVDDVTALVKFQWIEKDMNTRERRDGWSYPPGHTKTGKSVAPRPA